MLDDSFDVNLLRWISAEIYFALSMQAAREMYGKSYFSLGVGEKAAVDQAVWGSVRGNYQATTPEFLQAALTPDVLRPTTPKQSVGFQPQNPKS
jgi:hypothetical protein